MNKLKEKWFNLVLVAICIAGGIIVDNRNFRIIIAVVGLFCIYDFFSKPVPEKKKEENPELLSDEEMEQALLNEGEFSYDNYDEVCCPKCGAYLGKDKKVCDACGYGRQKYEEVCPECGKPNTDDLDCCAYCNAPLKEFESKPSVNEEYSESEENAEYESADENEFVQEEIDNNTEN